ncbi:MAG: hypothetical protein WC048_18130 [Rhizobium sp.]
MNTFNRTAVRPIDRFSRTIQAIEAMNVLVCNTLETDDGHAFIASGIYELFEQQCANLHELYAHYHPNEGRSSEAAEDRTSAIAPPKPGADYYSRTMDVVASLMAHDKTLTEIEKLTGLASDQIICFIEAMPEAQKLRAVEAATAGKEQLDPKALRAKFIADKISEGIDAGDIANALNLKKATVERVVRQLMAGSERAA